MKVILRILSMTLMALTLSGMSLFAQTATITTDFLDYPPGGTVMISGTGFYAGETVQVRVTHDPLTMDDTLAAEHQPWPVTADVLGNFNTSWHVPDDGDEAGSNLKVTGDGQSSGLHAEFLFADSDPTAQAIPYSQDFSSLATASTAYPSGWQGWQLSTGGSGTSFKTNAATADLALTASASASTNSGTVNNYNGKIGFLSSGSSDPSIVLAINTSGKTNITVKYDAMTIRNPYDGSTNTRINEMVLQYRVGISGSFTTLTGTEYQNNTTLQTGSGVTTPQNSVTKSIGLPPACENQAVVQVRWVQRDVSGAGGRPGFAVDNIFVASIGFANLQFPGSATISQGGSVNIYGQVYAPNVTEAAGAGAGISAWVGTSSTNVNPNGASFTWTPATFNTQVGNNDEWTASIGSALAPGTYYYATRFQLYGGNFVYGGFPNGAWNGTSNVNGTLTVIGVTYTITSSTGSNGSINPSGNTTVNTGANQSYTITPAAGYYIAGVLVDGVSNSTAKSTGAFTFSNVTANHAISATFAPSINYIYHEATTNNPGCGPNFRSIQTPNAAQSMALAWKIEYQNYWNQSRIYYTIDGTNPSGSFGTGTGSTQVISGAYNCGFASGGNTAEVVTGTIPAQASGTVVKYIISGWNTNGGSEYFANSGAQNSPFTSSSSATIFTYTVSPAIVASAGANGSISPSGTVNVLAGSNQTFTISANSGYYIANVLVDGVPAGAVGTYTFNSVTANHTISASFVPFINYVYHEATTNGVGCGSNNYRSVITPDNTQSVTAAWKIEYQFNSTNTALYYTTDGSAPSGSKGVAAGTTTVVNGSYNCTFNAGFNVDVAKATIPAQAAGTVIRYIIGAWNSGGGNEIFANSGANNSPFTSSSNATVFTYTVVGTSVDYANLQFPANATINTGGSATIFAQVYKAGLTDATSGQAPGISAWIGYSSTNVDPSSASFTWVPATFNLEAGNNDEYKATIGSNLPAGTYYFASRFQLTGGPFRYGGYGSNGGGFWGTTNGDGSITYSSGVLTVNCSTPTTPTVSANGPLTFCTGGSVILTSSYATGNTWSNGATTQSITVSNTGTFTVTYADAFGCVSTSAPVTVTVNPIPATPTISANGPTIFCQGGNVTLTSSSTTNNIWSTGETSQSIIVSTAGSYTVYVSSLGCNSATSAATVVTVNSFGGPVTVMNETVGSPSGNTVINSYSGWSSTAPISFSSTDGVTDVRNTTPSTYSGASGLGNVFLGVATTNNRNFIISGLNTAGLSSPALTFGLLRDNTAAGLTVEVSTDGTTYSPLSITQPPIANTWALITATGAIPATANLRIRFSKNNSTSFRIDDIKLTGTSTSASITQANGCGSTIVLTASSGSGYTWSTGATSQSITVNATGSYSVAVTGTNGCMSSAATNISSLPAAFTVALASQTNVTCNGGSNGSVVLNISGGTAPFSTSPSTTGLPAGTKTFTVTDANNCTATVSATITQPAAIVATATVTAPLCAGGTGTVAVSATGGNGSYGSTVGTFSVAAGAPYSFVVTDGNGCTSNTISGTMAAPSAVAASSSFTPVLCNGGTSTVTVTAAGGTGSYTGTGTFTVNAGPYSYTVTDGNGCTSVTSGTITEPSSITISETHTDVTCNGGNNGAINLNISGGTQAVGSLLTVTENFNTLASSGTSSVVPSGWAFFESGSNANTTYTAGTGSSATGDTYSFGTGADRAFGGLFTGSLTPFIGVAVTNNTGKTVTAIDLAYFGEQWRLGNTGRNDRLNFQYSLNATSLSTGTWTPVAALDFVAPNSTGTIGALDGNAGGNRSQVTGTITGLSIPSGSTIWLAWKDFDAAGADDGLAIDDVTYTLKGPSDYTYSWSNGATVKNISLLTAGTYTVTVKDGNNCMASQTVTISEPNALIASSSATAIRCNGETSTVTVSATGGTGSYTGTGTFTVHAGTFTYPVSDANGCITSTTITVDEPAALSASSSATAIRCNGETSTVTVSATGGTGSYTGTGTFTVHAGTFTYNVSDANGCATSTTITVGEPAALSASSSATAIRCNGETSTVTVSATGGTGSYTGTGTFTVHAGTFTYPVSDANGCITSTTITVDEPAALSASSSATAIRCNGETSTVTVSATGGTGSYTGTGTFTVHAGTFTYPVSDANGCITSTTITVGEPTALAASSSATTILCHGGSSTVTVSATGGTGSYTGTGTFTVHAGTFTYNVSDANGCATSTTITVGEPTALSASSSSTAILCHGGTSTVTVSATGGTGSYTGTGDFTVTAGTYTYNVTDANGCATSTTITVGEPTALAASSSATAILCHGGSSTVTVSATGGTGIYTGTGDFTVTAGTYTYDVSDANGCATSTTITIGEPDELRTGSSSTAILCHGGTSTVTVSANGGTAPYTGTGDFTVTAGTYTYNVTDANGCATSTTITVGEPTALSASSSSTAILCHGGTSTVTVSANGGTSPYSGTGNFTVPAGTYTYNVTDFNGCATSTTITVGEPTPLSASSSSTAILCHGGTSTVTVSATGGTSPYSGTGNFTVPAGTYTYNVTDFNGCATSTTITVGEPTALSASSSSTAILCHGGTSTVTVSANGGTSPYSGTGNFTVPAGTYTYNVTDFNGCATSTTITIGEPTALSASSSSTAILCHGGTSTVTVSATGGTSPYSGTGNFTVPAGTYTYNVTDFNGCATSTTITIGEPTALSASSSSTAILCHGGTSTVTVSATGGTSPYSGTGNFTVPAGTYTYNVTDFNGCATSTTITVGEPTALSASSSSTAILCHGGTSTVTVSANGGTAPYMGTGSFNRTAGTYTFNVSDANGCVTSTTITIGEPTALSASSSSTAILCHGGTSTVTVSANGGTAPYTGTGSFSRTAGTYTFNVSDANGCATTTTITVGEPTAIALNETHSAVMCYADSSAVILSANGGTGSYTFSNGTNTNQTGLFNQAGGTIIYTATDANSCVKTISVTVMQPTEIVVSSASVISNYHGAQVSCNGSTNATIKIVASGGTGSLTYTIGAVTNGTGIFTNLGAGSYTYTVRDNNLCAKSSVITVTEPAAIKLGETHTAVACQIGGISTVTITALGGTAPYTGTGNFQQAPGSHTYTVTDANGCTQSLTLVVIAGDYTAPTFTRPPDVTIPFAQGSSCYNAAVNITGDVTDEHDNVTPAGPGLQAVFIDTVSQCGYATIIKRTWHLADGCGNVAPDQIQTITVTDNTTPYIIYAQNEVHFGESNYIGGDVGVTDANGQAEFHKNDFLDPYTVRAATIHYETPSAVTNRVSSPATGGPTPFFYMEAGVTNGLPDYTATVTTAVPISANYKNLTIKKGVKVTVTGTLYGHINQEEGSEVTFNPGGGILNVENFEAHGNQNTAVTKQIFSNCTSLRVSKQVQIGENDQFNAGGSRVNVYCGNNRDDAQFHVSGKNAQVTANIYIPMGQLQVDGGDDNSSTTMTGWFIVQKLHSEGKNVIWSKNACMNTLLSNHSAATGEPTAITAANAKPVFEIVAFPNPTSTNFRLLVETNSNEPITVRVYDATGRQVTLMEKLARNSIITLGDHYKTGSYIAEVFQGNNHKSVRLIKLY